MKIASSEINLASSREYIEKHVKKESLIVWQDGKERISINDGVFEKLRIWSRDNDGNYKLFALGSKGVGAIFLGHVATPFALTDPDNKMQGQVRTSGVYVTEDTSIDTIQQLDMVI